MPTTLPSVDQPTAAKSRQKEVTAPVEADPTEVLVQDWQPPVSPLLDEIAEEQRGHIDEADEVLRAIIAADREPSHAEMLYFSRYHDWDKTAVKRELGRRKSVGYHQPIAGTSADREAMTTEATRAAELLADEGPKLATKIENLQRQLTALETDARNLDRRCGEQEAACERLRSLIPSGLENKYQHEHARVYSGIGPGGLLGRLNGELERITLALDSTRHANQMEYMRFLKTNYPNAVVDQVGQRGGAMTRTLSSEWPEIQSTLTKRKRELADEIERTEATYDREITGIDAMKNYYLR